MFSCDFFVIDMTFSGRPIRNNRFCEKSHLWRWWKVKRNHFVFIRLRVSHVLGPTVFWRWFLRLINDIKQSGDLNKTGKENMSFFEELLFSCDRPLSVKPVKEKAAITLLFMLKCSGYFFFRRSHYGYAEEERASLSLLFTWLVNIVNNIVAQPAQNRRMHNSLVSSNFPAFYRRLIRFGFCYVQMQ